MEEKRNCPCGQQCCQREFGYVRREDFIIGISSSMAKLETKLEGKFREWKKEIAKSDSSHDTSE